MPIIASGRLELVPYREIIETPIEPVDWLLDGLIANGDRVMVYGEQGSYKSWLLLDLGLQLASRGVWLRNFDVPSVRNVLYINEEMGEALLSRRINRLGVGSELRDDLPFRVMSFNGLQFDPGEAQRLLDALGRTGFDPEVIIIETLRRVLVGSENDAERIGQFWRNIEPIRQAGKTLIVSHHMRKLSRNAVNDARYRASGSTDILAGADTAFAIENLGNRRVLMECVKARNAEEPKPFRITFTADDPNGSVTCTFNGYREERGTAGEFRRAVQLITNLFRNRGGDLLRPRDIQAHLIECGVHERTAERAWKQVREGGTVENPRGHQWRLREEQQAADSSEPVEAA